MNTPKFPAKVGRAVKSTGGIAISSLTLLASSGILLLTGCAAMNNDAGSVAAIGSSIQGNVHGGQQPIASAAVSLYAAQTSGYGASSTSQLVVSTTTDANGNFTLPTYTCPSSPNDLVYLTAVGGDPGGGTNANVVLVAALGPCSNLTNIPFVNINEVTTVASAYALSGFMSDYTHVGSSSTNYAGLTAAFATVNNLVNIGTGAALSSTPAYALANRPTGATAATFKSIVPQDEINYLANIIATCVNTNGVGGSSTACSNLFSATNVSASPDTLKAALSIAKNPGTNVPTLFNLVGATPPFAKTMSSAPNDWTLSLSFIGGGLGGNGTNQSQSTNLAIDSSNNVWVVNSNTATVTKLNNLGAPVSSSTTTVPGGYSAPSLAVPGSLAIDTTGNVWISDAGTNAVAELTSAGTAVGSGFTFGTASDYGSGIAIDSSNNVWVVAKATLVEFSSGGTQVAGSPFIGSGSISSPTGAISIDSSNNVWMENAGNGAAIELSNAGALLGTSGNVLPAPGKYAAIDASGKFYAPQGTPGSGLEVFKTNAAPAAYYNVSNAGSFLNAVSIAVDGSNNIFTVAAGNSSGNLTVTTNGGTPISPSSTGYVNTNLTKLQAPGGVGIDRAGNVWIVNNTTGSSSVVEYVGVATPAITPLAAGLSKIGQKP